MAYTTIPGYFDKNKLPIYAVKSSPRMDKRQRSFPALFPEFFDFISLQNRTSKNFNLLLGYHI